MSEEIEVGDTVECTGRGFDDDQPRFREVVEIRGEGSSKVYYVPFRDDKGNPTRCTTNPRESFYIKLHRKKEQSQVGDYVRLIGIQFRDGYRGKIAQIVGLRGDKKVGQCKIVGTDYELYFSFIKTSIWRAEPVHNYGTPKRVEEELYKVEGSPIKIVDYESFLKATGEI